MTDAIFSSDNRFAQRFFWNSPLPVLLFLSLAVGIGAAFALHHISAHLWHLKFRSVVAIIFRVVIVLSVLALPLCVWGRTRLSGVCLLLFCGAFYVSEACINSLSWAKYAETQQGRLGYSYEGNHTLSAWLNEIERSLLAGDPHSRLRVENHSGEIFAEQFNLYWVRGQTVSEVLGALAEVAPCRVVVEPEGNPWSIGAVHGSLFKVVLTSTDTNANLGNCREDPFSVSPPVQH